ncbi:MAG: alpha/beta fold hydrolase [Candidatus Neomarinimicrobiota bacterium]
MKSIRVLTVVAALAIALPGPVRSQVDRREVGNLVLENVPDIPEKVVERMLQYQNVRSASFTGWHPRGEGLYVVTRFGETRQVHYVSEPGGSRRQLTFFNEPLGGAAIRPAGQPPGFLFTKDVGGSEFYQVFHFDLAAGGYTMLTDGKSRNGGVVWSNQGDRFAYYSTARNGTDWDIMVSSPDSPSEARAVLTEGGTWYPEEWSPDDTRLLVGNYISINESYLWVVNVASGEAAQVNPSDERISYWDAAWTRDGSGIYYTADQGSEFHQLFRYDLSSGESRLLTENIPWDVSAIEVSHDGRTMAYVTNDGGISRLHLRRLKGWRPLQVPELPVGLIGGLAFSPDDARLALTLNTPQTPSDTYALDIRRRLLTRWTYSEVGGLQTDRFAVPQLIHYPTFDRDGDESRKIPAFYYRPAHGEPPYPVVIHIHGGPEGQYRPSFSSTFQYWINELGVAVLAPNVRGSNGYGKTYVQLDNGFKREESVRDIGALLDWIGTQPDLDNERVAVYGGSYGGYMVLAAMTHYNDRLRTGIELVGISNFVTFLENTQDYRRDLRRVEYGDERDPEMREFLISISPTTNAAKLTRPMFIAQGLNDPRVPAGESEQIVAAIRQNGRQAWYMLAKDRGARVSQEVQQRFLPARRGAVLGGTPAELRAGAPGASAAPGPGGMPLSAAP